MSDQNGYLLKGADGSLYYVNESDLKSHRLSDDQAKKIREELNLDSASPHYQQGSALKKHGVNVREDANIAVVCLVASSGGNWRDSE